jgi:hypothetical protein
MRHSGSEFVVSVSDFFSSIGPHGQWSYVLIQMIIFYFMVILATYSFLTEKEMMKVSKHRFLGFIQSNSLFAILLFGFVVMSRLPTVIYGYQNPDESMWIGCAKVFIKEPKLWVSCDSSTSGPLVMFPLIALNFFGIPIDYGSAKLAAALVMAFTIVFTFLTYCKLFGKSVARLTVLPLAVAIGLAMTHFWDFFCFNGEQMPLLLISISLYLMADIYTSSEYRLSRSVLLAITLGLAPYAKLQSVPLGLIIAFFGFILIFRKIGWKPALHFALSGLIPSVVFISWIFLSGGFSHFWNSYILFNIYYAGEFSPVNANLFDKISYAYRLLFTTESVTIYYQSVAVICFFCVLFLNFRDFFKNRKALTIGFFSITLFLTALFSVGQPFRPFLHYTYFAILATSLLLGSMLFLFVNSYSILTDKIVIYWKVIPVCVLIFIDLTFFYENFSFRPVYNAHAEMNKNGYTIFPSVIKKIYEYTVPGDRIAVWGWIGTFYAETDLLMGTRFENTSGMVLPNAYQKYFLDVFMYDLKRNTPKIFLDATTPKAFRLQERELYGFDKYPILKDYISLYYYLAGDVDGFRIYVRK